MYLERDELRTKTAPLPHSSPTVVVSLGFFKPQRNPTYRTAATSSSNDRDRFDGDGGTNPLPVARV